MEKPLTQHVTPDEEPLDLKGYERVGGYQALGKALKSMTPQEVQKAVKDSNLRGRGGAGFSTGTNGASCPWARRRGGRSTWSSTPMRMEPGTSRTGCCWRAPPHQMVEAAVVSAYAIELRCAYIYLPPLGI